MKSNLLFLIIGLSFYTVSTAQVPVPWGSLELLNSGTGLDTFAMERYTYDGHDLLKDKLRQIWNVDSAAFRNNTRMLYTYNGSGNLNERIDLNWDKFTDVWDSSSRVKYTYDAMQRPVTFRVDNYNGGWQYLRLDSSFYGANGRESFTKIYWSNNGTNYDYAGRFEYTYDSNDTLTTFLYLWMNATATGWDTISRNTFLHNVAAMTDTTYTENYSAATGWENSSQSIRKHSSTTDSVFINYWEPFPGEYVKGSLELTEYHSDESKDYELSLGWDNIEEAYLPVWQATYFYGTPTGLATFEKTKDMIVYPNPATNEIFIQLPDGSSNQPYQVISSDGRLMSQGQLTRQTNRIDVSTLKNGLYYVMVGNGAQKQVERVIIEN